MKRETSLGRCRKQAPMNWYGMLIYRSKDQRSIQSSASGSSTWTSRQEMDLLKFWVSLARKNYRKVRRNRRNYIVLDLKEPLEWATKTLWILLCWLPVEHETHSLRDRLLQRDDRKNRLIDLPYPLISRKESLYYMSGTSIGFDPYELLAPDRIGPWGGWVSNPIQLLKFVVGAIVPTEFPKYWLQSAVDGTNVRNDLISRRSVIEWSTPSLASNRSYGRIDLWSFFSELWSQVWDGAWMWWGSMDGSTMVECQVDLWSLRSCRDLWSSGASAMLVRIASGHSMAVTTNKVRSMDDEWSTCRSERIFTHFPSLEKRKGRARLM